MAGPNPWKALTLEWQTSSPPPEDNFVQTPQVVKPPYGYGEPGGAQAVLPDTLPALREA